MELSIRMVIIAAVAILSVALILFILMSQTGTFEDTLNEQRDEAKNDLNSIWAEDEEEETDSPTDGEDSNTDDSGDDNSGENDDGEP